MVFLFDLTASQPNPDGKYHGGGKYTKKVLLRFLETTVSEMTFLAFYDSSSILDESIVKAIETGNIRLIDIKNKSLLELVDQYKVDRLYTALPFNLIKYGLESLYNSNCTIYATIHGLRTIECAIGYDALRYCSGIKDFGMTLLRVLLRRKLSGRDYRRYEGLFRKGRSFAVSNHTKYAIENFFPQSEHKDQSVSVFYSPDVTDFDETEGDLHEPQLENDNKGYFLLISGNRWLKNNLKSAIALDQLFSAGFYKEKHVVITGISNEHIYMRRLKNKQKFVFKKYVTENELSSLYKNAFAFVYMTLNEGFGYPPLEAMKFGTPTITSAVASVPEVCGDAVLYASPNSFDEIKNRLLQLRDTKIYSDLEGKGLYQYKIIKQKQDDDLDLMIKYLLNK